MSFHDEILPLDPVEQTIQCAPKRTVRAVKNSRDASAHERVMATLRRIGLSRRDISETRDARKPKPQPKRVTNVAWNPNRASHGS